MNKTLQKELVEIAFDTKTIEGDLTLPEDPQGIVIFAHGAGSSRNSPRNNFVAKNYTKLALGLC